MSIAQKVLRKDQYIVQVTIQLCGQKLIDDLKRRYPSDYQVDARHLYCEVGSRIKEKMTRMKMTSAKLGVIAAYGLSSSVMRAGTEKYKKGEFIRDTPIFYLLRNDLNPSRGGIEILLDTAVVTIIATLHDIVRQDVIRKRYY